MISTVCVDQDGVLWIGTNGGDINVFQKGKESLYMERMMEI